MCIDDRFDAYHFTSGHVRESFASRLFEFKQMDGFFCEAKFVRRNAAW
jgi:hypothetical protein